MNNNITQLRTPYHALGAENGPHVPDWARHRSVYRSAGRTLYHVETDRLGAARQDLASLTSLGWDVHIDRANDGGEGANIVLSRAA